MPDDGPVLPAVGATSVGVAELRAAETQRADRLFADPFAASFVRAAGPSEHPAEDARRRQRRAALGSWVVVRTRFLDELVLGACARGCRQVVIFGAGLDARAFRLTWPDKLRVFEIDLPEVLEFKEQVVRTEGWRPACERITVPVDLSGNWGRPLADAGFDAGSGVTWLAEGLLIYLTADQATELLSTVGDLSAPGSWLAAERANFADPALLEQARAVLGMDHFSALWQGGLGYDAAEWLPAHGWEVHTHDVGFVAAAYGRPADEDVGGGFLTAVRLGGD